MKTNQDTFDKSKLTEHDKEHMQWSRRQFLYSGGITGLGGLMLNNMPVGFPQMNGFLQDIYNNPNDNILVLVKLFGGNDGLNMVVPHSDDAGLEKYLEYRPTIGLKHGVDYNNNTLLSGFGANQFALPSTMESLMPLWNEGKMNVVHNVGYPKQNYSHFVSINLWSSAASDAHDKRINSGWIGRYLDQEHPAFLETPPTIPPALRIGFTSDLVFQAPGNTSMELVFNDPNEFYRLAQAGRLYETDSLNDCPNGQEREFVRQVVNNSLRYSQNVSAAYNKSKTKATFPRNTTSRIADQLQIVSRLIKGNLGTRVYMVYLNGFDTHASQKNSHLTLLGHLATSIRAFYDDLKSDGYEKNVTLMTFSEFGRTIKENGSQGTDHGNQSPLFVIGDPVKGGFTGNPMNLNDPYLTQGDVRVYFESQPSVDYRNIYSTLMEDFMCVHPELTQYSMGDTYQKLNLFNNPCNGESQGSNVNLLLLGHNPNPSSSELIDIKFSQLQASDTKLNILSTNGKTVAKLHDAFTAKGSYTVSLDPKKWKLAPGEYIYQLENSGKQIMRRFTIF